MVGRWIRASFPLTGHPGLSIVVDVTTVLTETPPDERRWRVWRSPVGQPVWARPTILLVAGVSALSYAWGIAQQNPQLYYAAAVRSMATGWHDFFFAAFDPAGLASIDKLPGAFWVQALSVQVFGPHIWALVLPQVVEGVLTVLLLYRVVRRTAGPAAGVVAALVMACTPETVALNRGNIPDTLLILLLVLAADRVLVAVETGRSRNLWYAGILIGLAFQTKMLQAWFLVPILALVYLICAPKPVLRKRIGHTIGFGIVALAISLSWMIVVSLIPAAHRPYVDGSKHNSLFEQVFLYNGFARTDSSFGVGAANFQIGTAAQGYRAALVLGPDNRLDHVFAGGGGRAAGWLVPLALVALIALAVLLRRRSTGWAGPRPAALLLWGGWLLLHVAVFLAIGTVNPYYLAVLAPPVAALIGWAAVEFARSADRRVHWLGVAAVALTVVYGWWLLQPAPSTVRWATVVVAVAACAVGAWSRGRASVAALLVAAVAAPAVAAGSLVADGYGVLDTPFESKATSLVTQKAIADAFRGAPKLVATAHRVFPDARYPLIAYIGIVASPFIFTTGAEVPAFGGFTGTAPVLTLDDLTRLVAQGQIGFALVNQVDDPRVQFIEKYCKPLPDNKGGQTISAYVCARPVGPGPGAQPSK